MELWNQVCVTNTKTTKNTNIGQMDITSICPQSQRKKATEVFGPYGTGWGIDPESETYSYMDIGDTKLCTYKAVLYYFRGTKEGRIPITSVIKVCYVTKNGKGYLLIDDEYSKKVQTNALTKGLSGIGFNSDVFEGKFDDDKYVQSLRFKEAKEDNPTLKALEKDGLTVDKLTEKLKEIAAELNAVDDGGDYSMLMASEQAKDWGMCIAYGNKLAPKKMAGINKIINEFGERK